MRSERLSWSRVRTRSRELDDELVRLTDALHRDEIARAEHRLRIETFEIAGPRGIRRIDRGARWPSTAQTSSRRRARRRWPSSSRPAIAASR